MTLVPQQAPRDAGVVNPANMVTAARYLTLPPFLYCIDQGLSQVALLIALLCGLLDKLDGLVAKLFDCKSAFGSIFDAITDAVCYGFFLVVLLSYGWIPALPTLGVLGLGVLNAAFRSAYARRVGRAVNFRSFAMERMVAYTAYLTGFGTAQYMVNYFFYGAAVFMVVVVVFDGKRMLLDPVPA